MRKATAVVQWESRQSRVRMRSATHAALVGIQHIGKREARRRLEGVIEATPVREERRRA
jgi:hypothetical protein